MNRRFLTTVFILTYCFLFVSKSDACELPPIAEISNPYSQTVCVGGSVSFDGSTSYDQDEGGDSIEFYYWNYSEDSNWHEDGATPSHIFYTSNTPGENYWIYLYVEDDEETLSEDYAYCQVTVVGIESVDTDPSGQEVACTNEDVTFRVVTSTSGNYDLIYWWGGGTPETQDGGETFTTSWSSSGTKIVWAECGECNESREIDIIDGFTVLPRLAELCDYETKDFEAWICVNGTVENVTADSTFSTSNGSMKKPTGEAVGPGNYRLHPDTPSSSVGSDWVRATYNGQTTDDDHDCSLTVKCCCTPQNSHIGATKYVSLLDGAKATIKTRYGDLCCEDCPLQPGGMQAGILGIIDDEPREWGETGYLRIMYAGEIQGRFAEVMGPGHHLKIDLAPSEGSNITYKVELDKSTGYWKFYYNGTLWHTFTEFSSYWQNRTCGRVYWAGEITNLEDDMPGTLGNKCDFTGCQYKNKDGGTYQSAGLTSANVDPSTVKWGAKYVSGTAFSIWDIEPGEKTCP